MEILFGTEQNNEPKPKVLTLGNFDGFHRGHQEIVRQTVAYGRENNLPSMLVTFHPHPRQILAGDLSLLTPLTDKLELLARTGLDKVLVCPFTRQFRLTPPAVFIRQMLVKTLNARHIIVGYDWGFGRDGAGTPQMIQAVGNQLGVTSTIVPAIKIGREIASSTAIRRYISRGKMEQATRIMGRPHSIAGRVVPGVGRARKLGFPTANITPRPYMTLPARGVYAAWADVPGGSFPAVANLGIHPTFTPANLLVEVHLLDYSGELYDKTVRIHFIKKLREEIRFSGSNRLIVQINADISQTRALLASGDMLKLQRI